MYKIVELFAHESRFDEIIIILLLQTIFRSNRVSHRDHILCYIE